MLKKLLIIIISLLSIACATSHNLDEDGVNRFGGGGFSKQEILSGFYKLMVRTNSSLMGNFSGVRKAWTTKAIDLCNSSEFVELKTHEISFNEAKGEHDFDLLPRIRTKKTGYILCTSSETSIKEANEYLANRGSKIN